MVGDFNAKLGKTIIKGDIHDMSNNGQKLHNMIIKYNLYVINSMEICTGIFTEVNNKIIGEKSVLDYVIASDDLLRYIKNMQIDTNKQFTPWRTIKSGKRFSDHNAIMLKLESNKIPSQSKNKRETAWNFNHTKGWERFQKITSTDSSTLSDCWNDIDCVETSYEKWSDKLNSILHECFPKHRVKKSKQIYDNRTRQLISERKNLKKQAQSNKTDLTLQHRIAKLDQKIDKKIAKFNTRLIQKKVNKYGSISKQEFWKLKRTLVPKSSTVPYAVIDKYGNEVTDAYNIQSAFLGEFKHRLGKREISEGLQDYKNIRNLVCHLSLKTCLRKMSPDFTMQELSKAISELKNGRCVDPHGLIREIFKKGGNDFRQSILKMVNAIKNAKECPSEWSNMVIQTIMKKTGSKRKLGNYRRVFLVPIASLIFEKLLKNRVSPHLEENMTKFQTGGRKGKGVVDNLFILRGIIDHAKYLGRELWLTFYDIEKCFDRLWLEDCINSLWDNGVTDDILYLIYMMNRRANIVIRTPFGNTESFTIDSLVKQGTSLGPILNNCSLDEICVHCDSYQYGAVEIKTLEFVDDIPDANNGLPQAFHSHKIITDIITRKRLKLSIDKCKLLKINGRGSGEGSLIVYGEPMKVEELFRYLGDTFNSKGDNVALCKHRVDKSVGSTIEIISLCKEVNFGKHQIYSMITMYQSVFLPRLIYNCESWSNLTQKDISNLQDAQLKFLRGVMEVPKSTPIAALFLEFGILAIQYEIEETAHILEKNSR